MGGSSSQTVGYHYRVAYHVGLCRGPIDAFLEFRAAERTAWNGSQQIYNDSNGGRIKYNSRGEIVMGVEIPETGPLVASGRIEIGQPMLFGGPKDQGGIIGPVDVMFGEGDQLPNEYLRSVFGGQTVAWRGMATLAFCGGQFGAMNPMPQKPAYKVRKIVKGWSGGDCWYPEKAEVPVDLSGILSLGPTSEGWSYWVGVGDESIASPSFDDSDWEIGASPFASRAGHPWTSPGGYPSVVGTVWPINSTIWVRRRFTIGDVSGFSLEIFVDNYATVWVNGHLVLPRVGSTLEPGDAAFRHPIVVPASVLVQGENLIVLRAEDTGVQSYAAFKVTSGAGLYAMNAAHTLYYVQTDDEKGAEPRSAVNDASLRAAADRLYDEGFGLCWEFDPAKDTADGFNERICRIIGGSFERSIVDGQWYLDLARGDYDLDSLPIIGDDDILEFSEQPTTLDRATNSVSVRYFDPSLKETVITPAVRAIGLVHRFGEIHETLDFPEIPVASLALRVAERELRARVTPTRAFSLVTTPRSKALRRNQYFRLQSPKRRIADMVCIVGEKQLGTLRSGAIRFKVVQDVYAFPDKTYAEVEPGIDTRAPQVPVPVSVSRAFEVPYIDIVALIPRAELEALPDDVGYLAAVAADPGDHQDFTLAVQADGDEYRIAGTGEWSPTAVSINSASITTSAVELASAARLHLVQVGMPVLWDSELCRVDGIDRATNPPVVTLARGCADTVPVPHAAGSRLWFSADQAAVDVSEYTGGEVVEVKLLSNTSSRQLPLPLASPIPVVFDQRQARPYPPAGLLVNGAADPGSAIGQIDLSWTHRDRVLQADQLIDQTMASIGPEPGTTYTVRWILNGTLVATQSDIAGTATSYTPAGGGALRIEVESVRGGLTSWQMHARELTVGSPLLAESGAVFTTEDNEPILME